jgi:tetratricopeptide (TPR) repeat protein
MIIGGLAGAIGWSTLCTYFGLPISNSHSLVGGIMGAGIAGLGFEKLVYGGLTKVFAGIVIAPIGGIIIGLLVTTLIITLFARKRPGPVNKTFGKLQIISSAWFALTHGANDGQKTMGIIYFYRGDIDKAFEYFNQSKETYEASGNIGGVARTYNNMGILYKNTGKITQAQESYLKAIEAFKKTDDAEGVALAYLNIGNLYNSQGDYKNALDNFLSALKFFEGSENKLKIAEVYNNIGILYGAQNNYVEALNNFEKALKIYKEIENLDRQADSYNNIGTIYLEQNKYSKALRELEKSKDLCLETGQPAKLQLHFIT